MKLIFKIFHIKEKKNTKIEKNYKKKITYNKFL